MSGPGRTGGRPEARHGIAVVLTITTVAAFVLALALALAAHRESG